MLALERDSTLGPKIAPVQCLGRLLLVWGTRLLVEPNGCRKWTCLSFLVLIYDHLLAVTKSSEIPFEMFVLPHTPIHPAGRPRRGGHRNGPRRGVARCGCPWSKETKEGNKKRKLHMLLLVAMASNPIAMAST